MLRCIYRMSQKQVPDWNKTKWYFLEYEIEKRLRDTLYFLFFHSFWSISIYCNPCHHTASFVIYISFLQNVDKLCSNPVHANPFWYLAYLDICQTGDWQNLGECTNSKIGFARRALQLHLMLILFSSEIISCRTVPQGLNLQILENRCVFSPATEKNEEEKELLKCCNRVREMFIVYLPEIRGAWCIIGESTQVRWALGS